MARSSPGSGQQPSLSAMHKTLPQPYKEGHAKHAEKKMEPHAKTQRRKEKKTSKQEGRKPRNQEKYGKYMEVLLHSFWYNMRLCVFASLREALSALPSRFWREVSLLFLLSCLCGCGGRTELPSASKVSASPPAVTFTEVTQRAGIHFKHVNGAFGKKWMPETMGSGCAFLDYDGDGWLDILLVNGDYWPGHAPQGAS